MMLVEFKLGRGMFMCLYCGWYEVMKNKKKRKKCEKEKDQKKKEKREKTLKKKNKKSMNNVVLISEVFSLKFGMKNNFD